MTFIKINKNDTVYDREKKMAGIVINVDTNKNVATVLRNEGGLFEANLFNLTVVEDMLSSSEDEDNEDQIKEEVNDMFRMVKDFHIAFNHPTSESPVELPLEQAVSRAIWTGEEALVEFIHASSNNQDEFDTAFDQMIEGLKKAKVKSDGMDYYDKGLPRIVAQSDALVDALYFIMGSFVIMGVEPTKLFEAVQASNMSKLFDDGKPRFRETDGKILKSPNFFPPEDKLEEEIKRQLGK